MNAIPMMCPGGYRVNDLTLDKADEGRRVTCSRPVDAEGKHRGPHTPPPREVAQGATPWESCPVQTDEYEWGNYCPIDPQGLGVHRCTLPEGHGDAEIEVPVPGGEPPTTVLKAPCVCRCGMKREPGKPKRDTA